MANKKFIAIDGDDVGNLLRARIISNDIQGISSLSMSITDYFAQLRSILEFQGYEIVFCAGDSLLCCTTGEVTDSWFRELPEGPCTISVGIGATSEYAYLGLQLAKARGKRQVVQMDGVSARTVLNWKDSEIRND